MTTIHGFSLLREQDIPEVASKAQIWTHDKTGARLLSLIGSDENKVFGISFRTPPEDSTGIAHILEHSVLCGSRKYPVKEPFVELIKGSLKTFLNAFTYPDKTCYPVASTNVQDFYNLIDVYLDAVFHPRISPEILAQEGWHYELESPEGPLTYQGVVYGEMKGVYSSPDSVLHEYSQQCVFPDTTYGLDSGGNPAVIPDLTYEQFTDFHRRYYHPANAFIFFSGDDDPVKRLEIADAYLSEFEPLDSAAIGSEVGLQSKLSTPTRVEKTYASGDNDDAKGMCTVNWLLPRTEHAETNLGLRMLEHALLGMPSSPLRKALLDSGLGEDTCGVGLEEELRQMYFSVGLKGMDPAKADEVRALILDTLESLAAQGLGQDVIQAAVNSLEFDLREMNTGRFPQGLALMLRSLTTWLYDADPLALLAFEAPLRAVKDRLTKGEPVFEHLIRTHLLDNPHQVLLVLSPDAQLGAKREAEEQERLAKALEAMDEPARKHVMAEAARLKELQEAHDSPEDLARIPCLRVADMAPDNPHIPCRETTLSGVRTLVHDLPTNGIVYVDLALDLSGVEPDLLPLTPLLGRALTEMGTKRHNFVTLTRRIASLTGGIDAAPSVLTSRTTAGPLPYMMMSGKATRDHCADLVELMAEILTEADFGDRERFRQMVLEEKARLEQRLVPAGHAYAISRVRAGLSPVGYMGELLSGVEQLEYVRRLAGAVETDFAQVRDGLHALVAAMAAKAGAMLNLTLPQTDLDGLEPTLARLPDVLADGAPPAAKPLDMKPLPEAEGLGVPAQVNYVAKGVDLRALSGGERTITGAELVVARHLRTAYLWDKIRVQGGAYGAFSSLDRLSGHLVLASYRDPNLKRTLDAFDAAGTALRNLRLDKDELERAIIGTIGEMDAHMLPDAKGYTSLVRNLSGVDEADLKRLRSEVLATTAGDFAAFAQAFDDLAAKGRVAVVGDAKTLQSLDTPQLRLNRLL